MSALDIVSIALLSAGALFFTAGTIGLLRLPDTLTRIHALTKVDNLGLGFTMAALMLQAGSWAGAAEIALIWLLALAASATAGYLIARRCVDERD
jgi:multicomponent Na+:H+ antiporter subunit G